MSHYVGEYPPFPDADMMSEDDWKHLTEFWRHEDQIIQALKRRPRISGGKAITRMVQCGDWQE